MTRLEYLGALEGALGDVDPSFKEDVLLELASHLDELATRHPELSEDDLVAGLSRPDILAAGLVAELGPEAHGGSETGHGPSRDRASTFESDYFRDSVRGFAGGRGGSSGSWEGTFPALDVETLVLSFPVADIELKPSPDDLVHVSLEAEGRVAERESAEPDIRQEQRRLIVSQRRRVTTTKVEVLFPSRIVFLEAETGSGEIRCQAAGASCRLSSHSGDLEVQDSGPSKLSTSSGDIVVDGYQGLDIQSSSGSVRIRGDQGVIRAKTTSGDLEVEAQPEAADLASLSGDLDLDFGVGAGRLKAQTTSGEIRLRAGPGFQGGGIVSVSGDIEVSLEEARLNILAESVSGEVRIDEKEAPDRVPHRLQLSLGQPEDVLALKSVSGQIEVDLS